MDDSRFRRAVEMRDGGNPSGSYGELSAMLQSATDSVEKVALLLNMANCKTFMGSADEASTLIQEARKLFPAGEDRLYLYADFGEAMILSSLGRSSEAAHAFQLLLSKYADLLSTAEEESVYTYARQSLGIALIADRRFEEGIPVLEDLLRRGVGDEQGIHLYLGTAYSFIPGSDEPAKNQLLAAANGPDLELTTEALCRLGIMEFQARRFGPAMSFLGRAVREGSESSEWRKVAMDYLGRIQPIVRTRVV